MSCLTSLKRGQTTENMYLVLEESTKCTDSLDQQEKNHLHHNSKGSHYMPTLKSSWENFTSASLTESTTELPSTCLLTCLWYIFSSIVPLHNNSNRLSVTSDYDCILHTRVNQYWQVIATKYILSKDLIKI